MSLERDDAALPALRHRIDERLEQLLARSPSPETVDVLRDAVLGPGQRLRPILLLLAARECGAGDAPALDLACALEMVHAASLAVDDLPMMDDAAQRRGRPALHVTHGPATALLAAVALLAQAFATVAALPDTDDARRAGLARALAELIGTLVGGQLAELRGLPAGAAEPMRRHAIEQRSLHKTAAAFVAAVEMATRLADVDERRREALLRFAGHLGQAYQIADDLRDADHDGDRPTFASVWGRPGAQALLQSHLAAARAALPQPAGPLGRFAAALFAGAWADAR